MRDRKVLSTALVGLLAAGSLALGPANSDNGNGNPGPNDGNTFGLCTAYFAGSERGQEMKRQAPPFQGLEAAAEAEDMTVGEFCDANGQRPGNGNGRG